MRVTATAAAVVIAAATAAVVATAVATATATDVVDGEALGESGRGRRRRWVGLSGPLGALHSAHGEKVWKEHE